MDRRRTSAARMVVGLQGAVKLVWIIILEVGAAAVKQARAVERQMKSVRMINGRVISNFGLEKHLKSCNISYSGRAII